MSSRAARRALRHSGANQALLSEINRLRSHNAALSLFLRGAIRAYGGGGSSPALTIAVPLLEMARDKINAQPFEDRVVLSLSPDPLAKDREDMVSPLDEVPWGIKEP